MIGLKVIGNIVKSAFVRKYGPELVTNGDFSGGATGWIVTGTDGNHIATFSGGTLRYQSTTTTPQLIVYQNNLTIGRTYRVVVVCSTRTSGSIKTDMFGTNDVLASGVGTITIEGVAQYISMTITRLGTNVDLEITSISCKEVL